MVSILACFVMLLNPLAGLIEPIPDLLPGIGNLDEVAEMYYIYWAWPKLEASIAEYRKPTPKSEEHRLEEIDYIDVKAEILPPDSRSTSRKTKTPSN